MNVVLNHDYTFAIVALQISAGSCVSWHKSLPCIVCIDVCFFKAQKCLKNICSTIEKKKIGTSDYLFTFVKEIK